jgi:hypothetical protein
LHGTSVNGCGVFTSVNGCGVFTDEFMEVPDFGHTAEMKVLKKTYAGQCKDGYACGLGVLTWPDGHKAYAEHGPDGQFDGRNLDRWADGDTDYRLYERGKEKAYADVSANGSCLYNREACAPDDPRLLALIAQVAPVEVRPAARAPDTQLAAHSPPSNRPMDRPARFAPAGAGGRRGHRGAPPIPHAVAGGCATQPDSSHTAKHDRAATCARDRFAVEVAREAPSCTLTTAALCTRSVRCHAIVQHTAC